MNPAKNFPRVGVTLLVLTCLLSISLLSCGGGSVTANTSPTTSDGPAAGPIGGSPPPPTAAPTAGVPTGNSNMTVLANLQQKGGWQGYALLRADNYSICSTCVPAGPEATWEMVRDVSSPSLSGSATQFDIGGSTIFSDILWNNHLIGDLSSQGVKDSTRTLVPSLHNFVYEAYFFGSDLSLSQALEFDINQFFNGKSFIWGHECRVAGGHEWDTWDNVNNHWIKTGIPCNPKENEWNHVVIEVQRTDDDRLLFKSITVNDVKSATTRYDSPTMRKDWYGVTINYQQDGNRDQAPYSIWLDKVNFSYW
jgi:hypothetical protein